MNIEKYIKIFEAVNIISEKTGVKPYAVGGLVRDIILDRETLDIDILVEGDSFTFSKQLQRYIGGVNFNYSRKFGTASFEVLENIVNFESNEPLKIDVARTREERYSYPGAIPDITFTDSVIKDLSRRDFSANAIAMDLKSYQLIDPFNGVNDINNKSLKILHPKSISDDPTRIFRGVRFSLKFGFSLADETISSLQEAKKVGAFKNTDGDRILAELRLAAKEKFFFRYILNLDSLNVLFSVFPSLSVSRKLEELEKLDEESEPEKKLATFLSSFDDEVLKRLRVSKKLLQQIQNKRETNS